MKHQCEPSNSAGPGLSTVGVWEGAVRTGEQEQSEPLFLTSSFVFDNAEQAAARFAGEEAGNVYSRVTNPTVRVFEKRLAALEGGERCVATGSGMSAILTCVMALLKSGDHIVSSQGIFGSTLGLFDDIFARFGVRTDYVPLTDYAAWAAAIAPETRMLFLETPSNPLMEIADIARLAELAEAHRCMLVVDNCFCTPALQQPIKLGADLVVHSATKYLDGQGRCIGGAIVGRDAVLETDILAFSRSAGPSLSPFNAWVFLKGLETLQLRMRAHCDNAFTLARWLDEHPKVVAVHYPGLSSHPQHALAARQQTQFGGMLSFEVAGGREGAWRVIDAVRLFSITANLGDTKSTITHPATTTHRRLGEEGCARAGIAAGLIRLSVGIEDVEDLIADLDFALGD